MSRTPRGRHRRSWWRRVLGRERALPYLLRPRRGERAQGAVAEVHTLDQRAAERRESRW